MHRHFWYGAALGIALGVFVVPKIMSMGGTSSAKRPGQ